MNEMSKGLLIGAFGVLVGMALAVMFGGLSTESATVGYAVIIVTVVVLQVRRWMKNRG